MTKDIGTATKDRWEKRLNLIENMLHYYDGNEPHMIEFNDDGKLVIYADDGLDADMYCLHGWGEDENPHISFAKVLAMLDVIIESGLDVAGWTLSEIPAPYVFCFRNEKTGHQFDMVFFQDENETEETWHPAYCVHLDDTSSVMKQYAASSILEAIVRYQN